MAEAEPDMYLLTLELLAFSNFMANYNVAVFERDVELNVFPGVLLGNALLCRATNGHVLTGMPSRADVEVHVQYVCTVYVCTGYSS